MAYSNEKVKRLTDLLGEMEGRKEHAYAAATWRDVPALEETVKIVEEQLRIDGEEDTLSDSIAVLQYVADRYDSLGRFALSARIYGDILALALKRKEQYGLDTDDIDGVFYAALRARNFYIDDDCEDLFNIATALMPQSEAQRLLEERKAHRRSLCHDPVEMTADYLAVIDEVEEAIEQNRTIRGHGSCYEVWLLKRAYLAGRDIVWHSPAELNPKVHFD